MQQIALQAVDGVPITTIVDNITEALLPSDGRPAELFEQIKWHRGVVSTSPAVAGAP